jgi:hypothetical protein
MNNVQEQPGFEIFEVLSSMTGYTTELCLYPKSAFLTLMLFPQKPPIHLTESSKEFIKIFLAFSSPISALDENPCFVCP